MYDYVWLCMTIYDYIWLCMTMYEFVWILWLCMTVYASVWHFIAMYDYDYWITAFLLCMFKTKAVFPLKQFRYKIL